MHVIRNTEEIRKFIGEKKTAVALGAFDGLHIGHYKVIRTAVESGLMNPQLESVSRQVRAWALRVT